MPIPGIMSTATAIAHPAELKKNDKQTIPKQMSAHLMWKLYKQQPGSRIYQLLENRSEYADMGGAIDTEISARDIAALPTPARDKPE